jgi:hypothetical protein
MALLSIIRAVSGNTYLVDSSKDASRLIRLHSLCKSLDILPLYIVRNPYGVTYSHVKRGRDLKLWAKKYAAYTDEIHQALAGRGFHLVEYEQLSRTPGETMEAAMAYLGLEMEDGQLVVNSRSHHNIGGNGLRFQTSFQITPDEAWRKNLTLLQKLTIYRHTRSQRLAISRLRSEAV